QVATKPNVACVEPDALGITAGADRSAPSAENSGSPWIWTPPVTLPGVEVCHTFVAVTHVRSSSRGRWTVTGRRGKQALIVSVPACPLLVYVHETLPDESVVQSAGEHVPVFTGWLVWPVLGPDTTSNATGTPAPAVGCSADSVLVPVAVTVWLVPTKFVAVVGVSPRFNPVRALSSIARSG